MLNIGTNYHPHDWPAARRPEDIRMMRECGLGIVRIGHQCWDSFEPSEGNFQFEWFDEVMEGFLKAGIRVIIDIATRPAPIWLHLKYPTINITDSNGARHYPHTVYMEDVGSPAFQEYAFRYADRLTRRYASHGALEAFGLCNELGAGFISFSEEARSRFVNWLKKKYPSIDELNRAWATHRWCRRVSAFEDIMLPPPAEGDIKGAPEKTLDMYRFFSDEIIEYIRNLKEIVSKNAPGVRTVSNFWHTFSGFGFDYPKINKGIVDTPGIGFYPGINPEDTKSLLGACMELLIAKGENEKPVWCLEFQTGGFGGYACPKKAMRMYAYLTLVHRAQTVCGWTWRTMLGGEEQYLYGLLDHDGEPSRKYFEFKQIASEFKKLEHMGFPRYARPEIAIAYSYESWRVMKYKPSHYSTDYYSQLIHTYKALFDDNMDCSIIDLRDSAMDYKIILIPGYCLMDEVSAQAIRRYVDNGGTVVMTAYSAKVNEEGQAFDTTLPGRLSDVFGIRAAAFERCVTHNSDVIEGGQERAKLKIRREAPCVLLNGEKYEFPIDTYEILEPRTAEVFASLGNLDEELPAVTVNSYGKGKAYYVAVPAHEGILKPLLRYLCPELDINAGNRTPEGVVSRNLELGQVLYINITGETKEIPLTNSVKSLYSGKVHNGVLTLEKYEVDVVEEIE